MVYSMTSQHIVAVLVFWGHAVTLWVWGPQGIVRAIKDYQGPLKEHEVTIFVRRGGPNYQEGLRVMGEVGEENTICVELQNSKTKLGIFFFLLL